MNVSFNAIQNVILIFPDERPVFLREVNNNMYNCTPYFWAKVVSELPFSIVTPTVFACITYWSIGLIPIFANFMIFVVLLILTYNASSGYSLIISASFSDKQLAVTLTPVLIIPFMLFAGFFVASNQIPVYMKEFEYLSIFKYAYTALLHNQFDLLCPFNGNDLVQATACAGKDCSYSYPCCFELPTSSSACAPFSQIGTGWPTSGSMAMFMLFCIYAGCYMIAWAILIRLSSTYE